MRPFAILLAAAVLSSGAGTVTEKSRTAGLITAPIRLDLYSDFTCPHCKAFHDQLLPLLVNDFINPGKAYIVFHEYTLTGPGHEYSREASNYAAAAAHVGKYAQVAGALFAAQDTWSRNGKVWDVVASALTPAERAKVQTLVKDPAVLAEVDHGIQMGNASHIDRTPTVVVSARGKSPRPWSFWGDYKLFKSYLDDQLK